MAFRRWLINQWDRTSAAILALAGFIVLLLGWAGVSRSTLATQQLPYLASGGLIGLFLLGVAATLWLSADLRDEWRKLDEIYRHMQRGGPDELDVAAAARGPEPSARQADGNGAGARRRVLRTQSTR